MEISDQELPHTHKETDGSSVVKFTHSQRS